MPRAVNSPSVEERIISYFRNAHLHTAIAVLNIVRGEVQARMPKPANPVVAQSKGAAPGTNGAPKKRVRRTKAELAAAKNLQAAFGGNSHEGAEEEV